MAGNQLREISGNFQWRLLNSDEKLRAVQSFGDSNSENAENTESIGEDSTFRTLSLFEFLAGKTKRSILAGKSQQRLYPLLENSTSNFLAGKFWASSSSFKAQILKSISRSAPGKFPEFKVPLGWLRFSDSEISEKFLWSFLYFHGIFVNVREFSANDHVSIRIANSEAAAEFAELSGQFFSDRVEEFGELIDSLSNVRKSNFISSLKSLFHHILR